MERKINTGKSITSIPVIVVLCSLVLLLGTGAVQADEGPGSTGAAYLLLPVGPKSISMGEVSGALSGDQFNWLRNPGTFHYMDGTGVGISHSEWIIDTRYDNLSFHHRINSIVVFGGGFTYLYRPEIQGFDEFGTETEKLKASNYNAVIGVGITPSDYFTAGVNLKYFNEKLAGWNAGGVGFDLGVLLHVERLNLALGLAAQNIGPDIKFESLDEPLPTSIRFGASHSAFNHDSNIEFTLAADIVKPRFDELYFCGGSEIILKDIIAVRVGYSGEKHREGNGLTLGGGFRLMDNILLDYAWTPYADLGSFHRISLFYGIH